MKILKVLTLIQLIYACACYFCDRTLTTSSGSVSGPESSSSYYSGGMDCKYSIRAPPGVYLKLTWSYFNVRGKMPSCNEDYVEVYTGCLFQKNLISRFCSSNMMNVKPHDIYSTDNCMELYFHSKSGGSRYKGGFRFSYTSISLRKELFSSCSSKSTRSSSSGVIGSPGWPLEINKNGMPWDKECETTIRQYNQKKVIKLNFMNMDVSSSSSCNSFSPSYVRYKGEKSLLTSREDKRYYCQKWSPFSSATQYYEIDIKFEVSRFYTPSGRGFVVGWVAYDDDEAADKAAKLTKYGWIAGVVIGLVVLGVVIFLCYRRHQRRNATAYTRAAAPATTTTVASTTATGAPNYPQQQFTTPSAPAGQYGLQPQQFNGPPQPPPQQTFPMNAQNATQSDAPPPYPGPPVDSTQVDGGGYPTQYPPQYPAQYQTQAAPYPPMQSYPVQQQQPYPPPSGYGATYNQPPPMQ